VLRKLEQRTGIVRRFAACFTDYRKSDQIEHPLMAVALNKDDVPGLHLAPARFVGKSLFR